MSGYASNGCYLVAVNVNESVVIVGAGPIGLACAISARRRGIDPLVIDAGAIVNSIVHYPVQMGFFTTPELLEIGGHPLVCFSGKPTREEPLMYYRRVVRSESLRVHACARLLRAARTADRLTLDVDGLEGARQLTCDRLILATGYYDNPRPLGVPGEDLPHVSHYFDEAHRHIG